MASPISNLALNFEVKRYDPQLVVPSKPTPREVKKLSDVDDQEGTKLLVPAIWFHKNDDKPSMEGKDPVRVIKDALGRVLVYYYPLAGRLKRGANGELMVDCNEEGVLFIEADADVTLQQLGTIQPPFLFLHKVLYNVPGSDGIFGCPLLLIQVTRLKCGGFIFAIRFNHPMTDGLGIAQFTISLSEMARGAEQPSVLPVWQRELLDDPNPPQVTHHDVHHQNNDDKVIHLDFSDMVHGSFDFSPNELRDVRKHLPSHLASCTRSELLTACVWKCRTLALNLDQEEVVQLLIVFDGRGKSNGLSLPSGYYGNVGMALPVVSKAGDICTNPLAYVVELVMNTKSQFKAKYTRSVADFMRRRGGPDLKIKENYVVSDVTKLPVGEVDFGWGCPEYGGPAISSPFNCYFVKSAAKVDDGILLVACFPSLLMKRFRRELKKMMSGPISIKHSKL
ncbi:hypothetical protein FNV43_RR14930 [Rhamnella rubrinervis]|uniref:Uncharacterized protein n=1 Tax=Rhamnella rubrinervis TaxID=2594499 RepID=A0A8K0MGP4_9ROSA|nr:hypothetical protein FNV43_RR14930 [Rhamnella rubrinervis]